MKTARSFKAIAAHWGIARRPLRSERGVSLVVVIMLMVVILAMTSAGMFFSSVELRASGNHRAGTQAFYAADTGINVAYAQIDSSTATNPLTIPLTPLGGGLAYQSGHITSGTITPLPLQISNTRTDAGYSLNAGTGYNTAGYAFYQYKINMIGTGPLSSAREVEAQVEYGPVPR